MEAESDLNISTLTRNEFIELQDFLENLSTLDQMRFSKIGALIPKICKQIWQEKYFWLWINFPKLEKYIGFSGIKFLFEQNKNKPILHVLFEVDKTQDFIDIVSTLTERPQETILSCEILASPDDKGYAHGPLLELSEFLPNLRQLIINVDVSSYFVESFTNLRKLRITKKIKPDTLNDILYNCRSLRELHLVNNDETLELSVEKWPNLKCLGLSVEKFKNASEEILKLPALTELYIAHDKNTNTADWIECVNKVIDAKHDTIYCMTIGGKSLVNSDWLINIEFDHCLHLRRLIIHSCDFLDANEELFNIIATMPQLLYMRLLNCDNLTAEVFEDIAEITNYNSFTLDIDPCPYKNLKQDKMRQKDVITFLDTYWKLVDGAYFCFRNK